jgi:hypothetical protein
MFYFCGLNDINNFFKTPGTVEYSVIIAACTVDHPQYPTRHLETKGGLQRLERICCNTIAPKVGYSAGNIWIPVQYINILHLGNCKTMVSYFETLINTEKYSRIYGVTYNNIL